MTWRAETRRLKEQKANELFEYLLWYKEEYDGNSPSYEEMRDALHLSSKSQVKELVDLLVESELIKRNERAGDTATRGLIVTSGTWMYFGDRNGPF